MKSWIIQRNEVRFGDCIGKGSYGFVYEATWKEKKVAVKACLGNLVESDSTDSREIKILASLPNHANVIKFLGVGVWNDPECTYIFTDLATEGSLHRYLHVRKNIPSPQQSLGWALQIAKGMQHLHSENVVHRDLKSTNILLTSDLVAKVCDFGTARILAKTSTTEQRGTCAWMAPEIHEGSKPINKMCDVFSYGMVLYEIYSGKIPYDTLCSTMIGAAVLKGERPPIPDTLPQFLHSLLQACWQKEPNKRPAFKDIVRAIQTESYDSCA